MQESNIILCTRVPIPRPGCHLAPGRAIEVSFGTTSFPQMLLRQNLGHYDRNAPSGTRYKERQQWLQRPWAKCFDQLTRGYQATETIPFRSGFVRASDSTVNSPSSMSTKLRSAIDFREFNLRHACSQWHSLWSESVSTSKRRTRPQWQQDTLARGCVNRSDNVYLEGGQRTSCGRDY